MPDEETPLDRMIRQAEARARTEEDSVRELSQSMWERLSRSRAARREFIMRLVERIGWIALTALAYLMGQSPPPA